MAHQLYASLVNQLVTRAAADLRVALANGSARVHGLGSTDPLAWKKAYLESAAIRLHDRLEQIAAASRLHSNPPNNPKDRDVHSAIVLVTDSAINDYVESTFSGSSNVKLPLLTNNPDAIRRGRIAGDEVHISDALPTTGNRISAPRRKS